VTDVRVELPTGEVIWARLSDDSGPSNVSAEDVLHRLDLADLRGTIQGVSQSVRAALGGLRPDQVSVQFGLELAVKTGKLTSLLAEASGKASIAVTVSWTTTEDVDDTVEVADAVAPAP
jgi:hypothetical protein